MVEGLVAQQSEWILSEKNEWEIKLIDKMESEISGHKLLMIYYPNNITALELHCLDWKNENFSFTPSVIFTSNQNEI